MLKLKGLKLFFILLLSTIILFLVYINIQIRIEDYEYECGCPEKKGGYPDSHPCWYKNQGE